MGYKAGTGLNDRRSSGRLLASAGKMEMFINKNFEHEMHDMCPLC